MTEEERREKKRLQAQKWREDHREQHREYQRNYRLEHKEECDARNKQWALDHPELMSEYKRKFAEEHPEVNKKSSANWRRTHPEHKRELTQQRRARIHGAEGTISKEEWEEVIQKYGPACLDCGEVKTLTMDHVVPISCGGTHTIDNVQPLCLSCNSSKGTKTIDYRPKEN